MHHLVRKINGVVNKAEHTSTATLKHEAKTRRTIDLPEAQRRRGNTRLETWVDGLHRNLPLTHFLSCSSHCTPALKCTPATSVVARSGNWTNIFGNPR